MKRMSELLLGLGSNLGESKTQINKAKDLIESTIGKIRSASSLYETEPWGIKDQPWFINQVILCNTKLLPDEILDKIQAIEKELGRIRNYKKNAERTIDIDILFINHQIITQEDLVIPHPRIAERRFVLLPLHEIYPDFVHPVTQEPVWKLLEKCADSGIKAS